MCRDCINNTGSYNMACIGCMSRWVMRFNKEERLAKIESNGRHDIDALKREMIRLNK